MVIWRYLVYYIVQHIFDLISLLISFFKIIYLVYVTGTMDRKRTENALYQIISFSSLPCGTQEKNQQDNEAILRLSAYLIVQKQVAYQNIQMHKSHFQSKRSECFT